MSEVSFIGFNFVKRLLVLTTNEDISLNCKIVETKKSSLFNVFHYQKEIFFSHIFSLKKPSKIANSAFFLDSELLDQFLHPICNHHQY